MAGLAVGGVVWRSPRVWLAAVAVLFFAAQVTLIAGVPLGWDESIYASQTDPRRPALGFSAPRSRGMSWLVAPVQALTGSTVALRVYLAALSSVGLFAAYVVWLRLRPDLSVPIAALGLSSLWLSVFYGPSLMPNMVVALAGVCATGALLCVALGAGSHRLGWVGGAAVAVGTVVRPGDLVPLLAGLVLGVLVWRPWRRRSVQLLVPPVAGAVVGALPWLVEAQLRYGGVLTRVHRSISTQSTGERFVPDYQLRAVDGPLLCRPCNRATQPIPPLGLLLWLVGLVLVLLALFLALRRRSRPAAAAVLPAWVGVAVAAPYLLLVGYAAPRFLLPAYALLVLPAAQAVRELLVAPSGRIRRVPAAVVVVALFGHLLVQAAWLQRVKGANERSRASWVQVAQVLEDHGVRQPCTLVGTSAAPVAYVARCDAVHLARVSGDEPYSMADLRAAVRSEPVALVLRRGERVPRYARSWSAVQGSPLPAGWTLRLAPRPR